MTRRAQVRAVYVFLAVGAALLSGCLERELKPLNPCLVSGVVAEIAVTNIDKIDLLFMVDNSGSMREEQAALKAEFPNLIRVLTSGDIDPTDDVPSNFPPVTDMHLGVVSSDLGLSGINGIPLCMGLGSDGTMADVRTCAPGSPFPRFLEFSPSEGEDAVALGQQLATEFGCVADLGTMGCGFEQQLENTLKAVWPADNTDVWFLPDPMNFGGMGQGGPSGANGDFIRNDPNDGLSLIAIILVTDEEDCSSGNMSHFRPDNGTLAADDPLKQQGLNTRCFYEAMLDRDTALDGIQNNLYGPGRYVQALRALRPGNEKLVIFAAIAGVPPELVEESDLNNVNFGEPAQANAFYDSILADSRMIEAVSDRGTAEVADDNLVPSCDRGENAKAYPPRRIIEVARGFGANGIVQSICQDKFTPAINQIIKVIAKQLGAVCLPRPLVRNNDGLVGCNVVWELPGPGQAAPNTTPRQCSDRPFLITPDKDRDQVSDDGGAVCTVAQLRLVDAPEGEAEEKMPDPMGTANLNPDTMAEQIYMEGWYYDDFSTSVKMECPGEEKQRVAFSNNAKPPTGVTVKLECLNETQSLADSRTNLEDEMQPNIGTSCEDDRDTGCDVRLRGGDLDKSMFCHKQLNVCVLSCVGDADCPASWVCDKRPDTASPEVSGGGAYCVNPTCGGEG
jgi:hypothetical protein